ncbi:MAG: DNA gyrase C-terminal beta-propeller domain-containing protein, partial [Anaerovoracaceae bacterium]
YDKGKFKKTGELIGAMVVDKDDEVLLINSDGVIIRIKAGDVSKLGRATQGVKIMRVSEDANIISMARAIREDLDEEDQGVESKENQQISLDTQSEK